MTSSGRAWGTGEAWGERTSCPRARARILLQMREGVHMPGQGDDELLQGRYRLDTPLGQGGFGVTWRATDVILGKPVCIKQFFDTDPEHTRTYLEEARSIAQFTQDPGIVEVLDWFVEDGQAYLVMELLGGEDLGDFVAGQGPLELPFVLELLEPVFSALGHMHARGIIHRDVSPDNIRVLRSDRTSGGCGYTSKLMDFGSTVLSTAAEFVDGDAAGSTVPVPSTGHAAMHSTVVVKPGYSSPEQYRTTRDLTPAADIYSLAATIWFCLTGETPMSVGGGGTGSAVMGPSEVRPGCVDAVQEAALMKALDRDPKVRPQKVDELVEGLSRGASSDAEEVADRGKGEGGKAPRPQRRLLAIVAASLAAAVAVGGVAWLGATGRFPLPVPSSGQEMPNVIGYTQDAAVEKLDDQDIRVASVMEATSDQREGTVVEQTPDAGADAPSEGAELVVSGGSGVTSSVPNVLGLSEEKARERIESDGFTVGSVTRVASLDYDASLVCNQDPEVGGSLTAGGVVSIVVSKGAPSSVRGTVVPVRDGLADYSWSELGDIADEIAAAADRDEALQVAASYNLVSEDGEMLDAEKSLDVAGTTIGLRVVDVYHDDLAGGGKAGLTFMDVNAGLRGPMNLMAEDGSNVDDDYVMNIGGWRDSNLRRRLQRLESTLPEDLQDQIKLVSKSTNNVGRTTDPAAITETRDALWVPSLVEVGGEVDWLKQGDEVSSLFNSMANAEGSQYAAFEQAGVKSAYNDASIGAIADDDTRCWLRSTSMGGGWARCIEGLDPSCIASADDVYAHYMLSFCL